MSVGIDVALTPEEVEALLQSWPPTVKIFCIDGVLMVIPTREALKRLPYDVMLTQGQPLMQRILDSQGNHDVPFLTPLTAEMLRMDIPSAYGIENVNKKTVNAVAEALGGPQVFGPDQDGVLRNE